MKITIKDVTGQTSEYKGSDLKIWRDGNTIEIYFHKSIDGGRDFKKVVIAVATNPSLVQVEENIVKRHKIDDALKDVEKEPESETLDTGEKVDAEALAITALYNAIENKKAKRKRRTKAEMEAAKNAK